MRNGGGSHARYCGWASVALAELCAHAGGFILPSSHEGQPIAVLEAISYGCPVILSDIPAHREISTSRSQFVAIGDIPSLASRLDAIFCGSKERLDVAERERLMRAHDWRHIARHTLDVYHAALSGSGPLSRRDPI